MGLGYALSEEAIFSDGQPINDSFLDYRILTTMDVPEIIPVILEKENARSPEDIRGVGEPPTAPTAAAIANAVYDAVGVRINNLPLTPERVYRELIDRFGERITTPVSYGILALCCLGYAFVPLLGLPVAQGLWILIALWIVIKLAQPLGLGLRTYVYRTAPPEELTPTLSAGVTFDHISSVSMPFLYGALLPVIEYEGIFMALAVLILLSIPFARALQVRAPAVAQPVPSGAE